MVNCNRLSSGFGELGKHKEPTAERREMVAYLRQETAGGRLPAKALDSSGLSRVRKLQSGESGPEFTLAMFCRGESM